MYQINVAIKQVYMPLLYEKMDTFDYHNNLPDKGYYPTKIFFWFLTKLKRFLVDYKYTCF